MSLPESPVAKEVREKRHVESTHVSQKGVEEAAEITLNIWGY
jgi:hypothetical protein